MAAIAEVGAGPAEKPINEKEPVTIYFGIFFDGTNNHRLQVLLGKNYRGKKGLGNTLNDEEREIAKKFKLDIDQYDDNNQLKDNGEISALQREKSTLEKALRSNDESDYFLNTYRLNRLDSVTKDLEFEVSKYKYDETIYKDHAIQTNDFTNIAILESFYRAKNKDLSDNEYAYKIYVSGSGVTRDLTDIGDWRGAGFGQGSTGVVQKVSDAVSCVNRKLALFSNVEDKNITLIFHLFGFSRGATEARIFAHVFNHKKEKKNIKKEKSLRFTQSLQKREKTTEIILHCSDTKEGKNFTMEQIHSWHLKKGSFGIGYNYYIDLNGEIWEGRPENCVGAHTINHNSNSIGICYCGGQDSNGKPKDTRNSRQISAMIWLCRMLHKKYPNAKFHGHREFANKECPCFDVQTWMNTFSWDVPDDKILQSDLFKYVFDGRERIKQIIKNGSVSIPAMGIYDTVASVGVLFKNAVGNQVLIDVENSINTWSKFHHKNVEDLGLNDLGLVGDVYHICALDEYRENFALVPIYESDARKKTEIYIPGCHADVGGGYSEGKDKKVTLYAGDNTYYPIIPKPYHLILDSAKEEPIFKKENYVNFNNEQWPDQNMRLRLSEIGWVNSTEKGKYNYVPPISFSFDKSTKKGYSYIGLHLMRDYFDYLGLFNSIEKFSVPPDLNALKREIITFQGEGGVDKCFELNPAKYAWLRNQYLHFSAEEYWNINQVKVNSPHFFHKDKSKYYCRIEYTNEYCKKVDKEYVEYQIKRLEMIENYNNQML